MSEFDAPYDRHLRELARARVSSSPNEETPLEDVKKNLTATLKGVLLSSVNDDQWITTSRPDLNFKLVGPYGTPTPKATTSPTFDETNTERVSSYPEQ